MQELIKYLNFPEKWWNDKNVIFIEFFWWCVSDILRKNLKKIKENLKFDRHHVLTIERRMM